MLLDKNYIEPKKNKYISIKKNEVRRDNLKDAFWSYDHILISKDYNSPIPHSHLAKHLIFSINNEFECTVESNTFFCKGVCIDSNIEHTVNYDSGDLLVFLFDETSNLAKELDEKYLKGLPFCLLKEELSLKVGNLWINNFKIPKRLDEAILSACNIKLVLYMGCPWRWKQYEECPW